MICRSDCFPIEACRYISELLGWGRQNLSARRRFDLIESELWAHFPIESIGFRNRLYESTVSIDVRLQETAWCLTATDLSPVHRTLKA